MKKETQQVKAHSEEYFVESRDFWWNHDFMELMAQRWQLDSVQRVLDVGCGIGHWGRVLLPLLPEGCTITGIDMEERSVERAREIARGQQKENQLHYQVGRAEQLPFSDESFDMVTCQTLLIHLADVPRALREMVRVLKPGGILVAAEPNNIVQTLVEDSQSSSDSIAVKLARVEFALRMEAGKKALGEGHSSVGDLVPGTMAQVGLTGITVHLNDRSFASIAPYGTPSEKLLVSELESCLQRGFYGFEKGVAKRYYLAGGGEECQFEHHWAEVWCKGFERSAAAYRQGIYHGAGGLVFYLCAGRKQG